MKILDIEQGTEEWFKARIGIPTASNFNKIVTAKGDKSKQADKFMYKLAGEAVSGEIEEQFKSSHMERGVELEEEARQLYQIITGNKVDTTGICLDNGIGYSPDGMIGEDGLLEIKCPSIATHVKYLLDNKCPTEYVQQVQGGLLITDRKWVDFVSYYPNLKPLIVRVNRDEELIIKMKIELELFCNKLKETINKIK